MTVLILAQDFDPTVDAVVTELGNLGVPTFRTDLSEFPGRLSLRAWFDGARWRGTLANRWREVELEGLRSIWHRNPSTYGFPDSATGQVRDFLYREAKLGLGGVLAALDVLWVNHPNRRVDAMVKPYQWQVAADCGLELARTVITNDPDTAQSAVSQWGRCVTKALGPAGISDGDRTGLALTRPVTEAEAGDIGVSMTATTVQQQIPKAHEVRLTVIGDRWFPIAIHADSAAARQDWRSDFSALRYEPVPMPEDVVDGVSRYLKRTGLVLAGLDFVVRPDGQWVFLEANTGPQFGWLDAATGAGMTTALAELLANGVQR